MRETTYGVWGLTIAVLFAIGALWGVIYGWQYFKVFRAEMTGAAELAQAEQNRQSRTGRLPCSRHRPPMKPRAAELRHR